MALFSQPCPTVPIYRLDIPNTPRILDNRNIPTVFMYVTVSLYLVIFIYRTVLIYLKFLTLLMYTNSENTISRGLLYWSAVIFEICRIKDSSSPKNYKSEITQRNFR